MNTPRLAILQTRIHPPALSPLAALVDALNQDVAALDLHLGLITPQLTGDEVAAVGDIMAMMITCSRLLTETVQNREARLMRER